MTRAAKTTKSAQSRNVQTNDSRTHRETSPEARGERGLSDGAERSRWEDMTEDDIAAILRDEYDQSVLPSPPTLPGFHLCWLTTVSTYDPLAKRMRLGYQPVLRSELPGFDPSNGQALEGFSSHITCNEMVLCKLPERVYQALMKHVHHFAPLQEEEAIVNNMKQVTEHSSQLGKRPLLSQSVGDEAENGLMEMEESLKQAPKLNPSFS